MASATVAASAGTISGPAAPASDKMDPRMLIAFFAMVLGMFMSILDIQVVSASLAEIQAGLSAGSDEIAWVQTAYLIAEVIMIPLSGTLARIISTRYLFAASAFGTAVQCDVMTRPLPFEEWARGAAATAIQSFIGSDTYEE